MGKAECSPKRQGLFWRTAACPSLAPAAVQGFPRGAAAADDDVPQAGRLADCVGYVPLLSPYFPRTSTTSFVTAKNMGPRYAACCTRIPYNCMSTKVSACTTESATPSAPFSRYSCRTQATGRSSPLAVAFDTCGLTRWTYNGLPSPQNAQSSLSFDSSPQGCAVLVGSAGPGRAFM